MGSHCASVSCGFAREQWSADHAHDGSNHQQRSEFANAKHPQVIIYIGQTRLSDSCHNGESFRRCLPVGNITPSPLPTRKLLQTLDDSEQWLSKS